MSRSTSDQRDGGWPSGLGGVPDPGAAALPLPRGPSVFGVVARAGGTSLLTRKHELVAFSHVIEDEFASDLGGAHLFGSFQRPEYYAPARQRWERLAREAVSAYVFAAFGDDPPRGASTHPVEVAVDAENPLRQEWAILVDRPRGPIAMSAVERPGQDGVEDRDRLFDSAWTTNPAAVRKAARVCALTAATAEARGARAVQFELSADGLPAAVPGLAHRVLDRLLEALDG